MEDDCVTKRKFVFSEAIRLQQEEGMNAAEEWMRKFSQHPVENAYWKLPHCNIDMGCSVDQLHQVWLGLVPLLMELTGKGIQQAFYEKQPSNPLKATRLANQCIRTLEERMQNMPYFQGIRVFKEFRLNMAMLKGREYKMQAVYFQYALNGLISSNQGQDPIISELLRLWIALLKLVTLTHGSVLEKDMPRLQKRLIKFEHAMQPLLHLQASGFNMPKIHMTRKYDTAIQLYGSLANSNSEVYERDHGEVKDPYRYQTNRVHAEKQVIRAYTRKLAVQSARFHRAFTDRPPYRSQRSYSVCGEPILYGTLASLLNSRPNSPELVFLPACLSIFLKQYIHDKGWAGVQPVMSTKKVYVASYEWVYCGEKEYTLVFVPVCLVCENTLVRLRKGIYSRDLKFITQFFNFNQLNKSTDIYVHHTSATDEE
eukprot:TRINITY_DN291_c0_g1::TRINITY_DN291_c0_g1_i1::g.1700::m.1700 TRINITY_DN291_c0_g1::TRINITY_DN291_c0_g1_i1::g.1700  ORF type:complete len:426 (-),score=-17.38 TRINITY_DN291_c0_g1_i1:186-1463(-)